MAAAAPKPPIDATATAAWAALKAKHDKLAEGGFSLKEEFASDPERVSKLSFTTSDLLFDL